MTKKVRGIRLDYSDVRYSSAIAGRRKSHRWFQAFLALLVLVIAVVTASAYTSKPQVNQVSLALPNHASVAPLTLAALATETLASFLTPSFKKLSRIHDLDAGLIINDQGHWEDSGYQTAARVVRELRVVNDFTRSGMALM